MLNYYKLGNKGVYSFIRPFHTNSALQARLKRSVAKSNDIKKSIEPQNETNETFDLANEIFKANDSSSFYDVYEPEHGFLSADASTLPFQDRRHSQTFGQLAKNQVYKDGGLLNETNSDAKARVIENDGDEYISEYRNSDGSFIHGTSSREARTHKNTLIGRTYQPPVEIPQILSNTINNNMLRLHNPKTLRKHAAKAYVLLEETSLHRRTSTANETDSHLASFFIQNYASVYRVLHELKTRTPNFSPQRILDVGFGPATGMVALNELMGDDFSPKVKDAVVFGSKEMKNRARIILSRQWPEQPDGKPVDLEELEETAKEEIEEPEEEFETSAMKELEKESAKLSREIERELKVQLENNLLIESEDANESVNEELEEEDVMDDEYVGPVNASKLKIRTRILQAIPSTKKYDLIIATHQLLTEKSRFPMEVDQSIDILLKNLAPGGHLILVERGTPLGFETIARARQVMIRPENYLNESNKLFRPWIRGSEGKPSKASVEIGETDLEMAEELERKFGKVSEDDLKFEFEEELDEEELLKPANDKDMSNINYHLKVVAPCSHHAACPMQIGKPSYYSYPQGKKLSWCHFSKPVVRPKFSMELKKGIILATKWATPTDGVGIRGMASAGSGRSGGTNYETANYSYLIMERANNDKKSISEIIEAAKSSRKLPTGHTDLEDPNQWPRILRPPMKKKGHVLFEACAPSGKIERWTIPKSFGAQAYRDVRKASSGDLWALNAKTKLLSNNDNDKYLSKLEQQERQQKTANRKAKRAAAEQQKKNVNEKMSTLRSRDDSVSDDIEYVDRVNNIDTLDEVIDLHEQQMKMSKKQKLYDKKHGI